MAERGDKSEVWLVWASARTLKKSSPSVATVACLLGAKEAFVLWAGKASLVLTRDAISRPSDSPETFISEPIWKRKR